MKLYHMINVFITLLFMNRILYVYSDISNDLYENVVNVEDEIEEIDNHNSIDDSIENEQDDHRNIINQDNIDDESYNINNPPGLISKCIFPDDDAISKDTTLYAGRPRSVVVGIENKLSTGNNYWVHYIYGSLYHPKHKQQLMQNLTAIKYVKPVIAQSGSTFNYMIWLHESFAEKNFTLVIFAHMTNDKHEYIYPVFNETIKFMELPENTYDLKFLFMIFVLTATTIAISKLISQKLFKGRKNKKQQLSTISTNNKGINTVDPDWLPPGVLKKQKSVSSKRS